MYKALFELSADRGRLRLAAVLEAAAGRSDKPTTSVLELFSAYARVRDERNALPPNLAAIKDQLIQKRRYRSSADDLRAARVHLLRVLLGWAGAPVHERSGRRDRVSRRRRWRLRTGRAVPELRRTDRADRLGRRAAQLSRDRGQLPVRQGPRREEPDRAGRGQFRRTARRCGRSAGTSASAVGRRRPFTCRTSSSICFRTACSTTSRKNVAALPIDRATARSFARFRRGLAMAAA